MADKQSVEKVRTFDLQISPLFFDAAEGVRSSSTPIKWRNVEQPFSQRRPTAPKNGMHFSANLEQGAIFAPHIQMLIEYANANEWGVCFFSVELFSAVENEEKVALNSVFQSLMAFLRANSVARGGCVNCLHAFSATYNSVIGGPSSTLLFFF